MKLSVVPGCSKKTYSPGIYLLTSPSRDTGWHHAHIKNLRLLSLKDLKLGFSAKSVKSTVSNGLQYQTPVFLNLETIYTNILMMKTKIFTVAGNGIKMCLLTLQSSANEKMNAAMIQ
jgi:hypothetical protein